MEGDGLVIWGFRSLEDASSAGVAPSARVGTIKIAEGSGPLSGAADGIDTVDDELGRKKRREMKSASSGGRCYSATVNSALRSQRGFPSLCATSGKGPGYMGSRYFVVA